MILPGSHHGPSVALKVSEARVLKDALAYPGDDFFEQSVGRSVRRHGGDYADYLSLIARVRETARERKVSFRQAAQVLAD